MYTGETDLIHETEIKELYLVILFELLYRATQVYTMLSIIKIVNYHNATTSTEINHTIINLFIITEKNG